MEKRIRKYLENINPLVFGSEEEISAVSKLGRGEPNMNFLIETSKRKYLMRFDIINDSRRFAHEYEILKRIESLNISQKPLLLDLRKKYLSD